jgi:hypothetical protein
VMTLALAPAVGRGTFERREKGRRRGTNGRGTNGRERNRG